MPVFDHHPLAATLARVGRDRTTGRYYRLGDEAHALDVFPDLKAEFDRIDALDEADMLREYGFSIEAPDGSLVRMKGGAVRDRYRPTADGDFTHDEASQVVGTGGAVSIVWQPRLHHLDPDADGHDTVKNYIWPRERIRLTYGHALKMRAYQQRVTEHATPPSPGATTPTTDATRPMQEEHVETTKPRSRRRRWLGLGGIVALALTGVILAEGHAPTRPPIALAPGDVQPVTCADGSVPGTHLHATRRDVFCATPTPAPTATPTPAPALGNAWHPAGSHDGLNTHEHGDAPPAWVTGAFTQTRESHVGYKGADAVSAGGVESYLIEHIITTEAARSHGDHDYALWLRDPESGHVYHWEGASCFGDPCTAPIPERTSDTGERPIALGERSPSDGCETWYSDPGSTVMDVGWTVCDRYQAFDGTLLGGVGAFRTVDWVIPCDRLAGAARADLLDNCRTEFGVSRLSFLVQSRDYGAPGLAPIN